MKHAHHLSLNTIVTIVSLVLMCFMLYTVTVRQDVTNKVNYENLMRLIEKQQENLRVQQQITQSLERDFWNFKRAVTVEPTPGEIVINLEGDK